MGGEEWKDNEKQFVFSCLLDNRSPSEVVNELRDNQNCNERSKKAIKHKEQEWKPFIKETQKRSKNMKSRIEELKESLLNVNSKMSKMSYDHNERKNE